MDPRYPAVFGIPVHTTSLDRLLHSEEVASKRFQQSESTECMAVYVLSTCSTSADTEDSRSSLPPAGHSSYLHSRHLLRHLPPSKRPLIRFIPPTFLMKNNFTKNNKSTRVPVSGGSPFSILFGSRLVFVSRSELLRHVDLPLSLRIVNVFRAVSSVT